LINQAGTSKYRYNKRKLWGISNILSWYYSFSILEKIRHNKASKQAETSYDMDKKSNLENTKYHLY
jgi:hypothetical protein